VIKEIPIIIDSIGNIIELKADLIRLT